MRCRFYFRLMRRENNLYRCSDSLLDSERGVKKAPELLPEYYKGRDEDQGSIGL